MPPENRVRRHNRRDLRQEAAAERRTRGCQPPTIRISQPDPRIAQLRRQDVTLFAQVPDDLVLLALELTENGCDEQVQWNHSAESTPPPRSGFEHYALVADRPSRVMTDAIGLLPERSGQQLTIAFSASVLVAGTNATSSVTGVRGRTRPPTCGSGSSLGAVTRLDVWPVATWPGYGLKVEHHVPTPGALRYCITLQDAK